MRRLLALLVTSSVPAALLVATAPPSAAVACTIVGTAGDDVLRGTDRADVICGRGGDDRLLGRDGADVLRGGPGRDILVPGHGRNDVRGGRGRDTVSYARLPGPVVADLMWGTVTGPVDDEVTDVESVVGTSAPDRLIGDDGVNVIEGRGGGDVLVGTIGADDLHGGRGTDTLTYAERFEDPFYSGVAVDLASGRAGDGTVEGVENVTGTHYIDFLYGDAGPNVLDGGADEDWLDGRGGRDALLGGSGEDLVFAGPGGTAADPELVSGGPGWDQLDFFAATVPVSASEGPGGWDIELDGTVYLATEFENLRGTPSADHIHVGGGATEVFVEGGGGADDIDTTDGFGGDWVIASNADPAPVCVGDPGDDIDC